MGTARQTVKAYVLRHALERSTVRYYERIAARFERWARPRRTFTADNVSRFLLDLEAIGRTSHYRRSVRNALVTLLRFAKRPAEVRGVKLTRLRPAVWSAEDVNALLLAVGRVIPEERRTYWRSLIIAAWYSGMSQGDLHRLRREDIDANGVFEIERAKTRAVVVAWLPAEAYAHIARGLLWPRLWSIEWTREVFARIVTNAGLTGSFKKLRKSSGTAVERLYPGRGHEHLANGRRIFEAHYLSRSGRLPLIPPSLTPGVDVAHRKA